MPQPQPFTPHINGVALLVGKIYSFVTKDNQAKLRGKLNKDLCFAIPNGEKIPYRQVTKIKRA